jgi:hypothetical protein
MQWLLQINGLARSPLQSDNVCKSELLGNYLSIGTEALRFVALSRLDHLDRKTNK